jgi:hypothetical protein
MSVSTSTPPRAALAAGTSVKQRNLYSQPVVARDWAWALRAVAGKSARCEAVIPDTILLDAGAITGWFFTSKDGFILRKTEKSCTPHQVLAAFTRAADSFVKSSSRPFAEVFDASWKQRVCFAC